MFWRELVFLWLFDSINGDNLLIYIDFPRYTWHLRSTAVLHL
jgi:hypothetical protein